MRLTEQYHNKKQLIEDIVEEKNLVRQYLAQCILIETGEEIPLTDIKNQFEFLLNRIKEEEQKLSELDSLLEFSQKLDNLFVKDML